LCLHRPEMEYVGLFAVVDGSQNGGRIRNVFLASPEVTGGRCTGALVGQLRGGTEEDCLEDCFVIPNTVDLIGCPPDRQW